MKNKKVLMLSSAVMLAGCGNSSSIQPILPDNEVNVIILAGQSNAEGCSYMDNIERYCTDTGNSYEEYATGYEDVKITFHHRFYFGATSGYYSNKEEPFQPRFINVKAGLGANSNCVGPELGIAQYIHNNVKSDRPTYIIKFTSGGTGFGSVPNWNSPSSATVVGDLYQKFTTYVTNGLNDLENKGLSPKLRAFVWMQGEADGSDYSAAKVYAKKLSNMINDFRKQFSSYAEDNNGNNIGVIDGHISDSGTWLYHEKINQAKETLAKKLPNYYTVDTNSTGLNLLLNKQGYGGGDNAHYTIDSILKLGNEFAKQIIDHNLLRWKEGEYKENFQDFSIEDGLTRNNILRFEAEKGIVDLKRGTIIENNSSCSNGSCLGYFWQENAPRARYVFESDKDEENALISIALASTVGQLRKELPHPMYKVDMVSVNGVPMRINGTLQPRNGTNWYNFSTHSGFANLKKGINYIDVHYDYNATYSIEDFRVNIDYLEIKTSSAVLKATETKVVEAEVCELEKAIIQPIAKNAPSNSNSVTNLNEVGASITGKFESSKEGIAGLLITFGLNTPFKVNEYLKLEVNGVETSLNDTSIYGYNFDRGAGCDWTDFLVAEINIKEDENTFKLTTIKEGLDVDIDCFKISSSSIITVAPIVNECVYKFEGEDTSHFTYTGSAKITSEANSNSPSGGQYIGGLAHTNSGFIFRFNSEVDQTVTIKICVGLVVDLYMDDIFDMYLSNSTVNEQLITNFNAHLPVANGNTWFDWTIVTLGTIEVKQGQNVIRFNHPDTSKYGVNVDYILVEAVGLIS